MIVLSKTKTLDNYFIDENAVITDKFGNVQKQYINEGRYKFKGFKVHRIMLNTFVGVKDGDYVVHHLDENKLNNKLSNLIYLTRAEHSRLHKIGNKDRLGKHHSVETKQKISAAKIGKKNHLGKHHSTETKAKIGAAKKDTRWFNNGIKSIRAKECPEGFVAGRIKK